MSEPTDDVAETLFENRSDPRTYRLTLDDERAFEVTTADFEYDPADEYGDGDFRQVIEFRDAPDLDLDDNRYATQQGEIDTVETDDGWGTPVLHAAVQHVEDDDLVGWEYPTLGTTATAEKVTDGE
uniref:Uncharacterized protein n=1 Tax=Halorubrum lacusprofundi TaxID=2247 RepID=A0A218KRX5_9EURY|nr:hypothetical protein [Halorubrum lacusprofundi]AQM75295.1 hypothetical protein [Halorubrum lacusprofundi]